MEGSKLWGWLDPDHPDPLAGHPLVEAWLARNLGLPVLTATPPVVLDPASVRKSRLTPRQKRALVAALGEERVSTDPALRASASLGQNYHDQLERRAGRIRVVTDAVVRPENADEVVAVLAAASRLGFRVTPRGGGTSVVGGLRPPSDDKRPWVIADLGRMNRVLTISLIDRTVTAEAGIRLPVLEDALEPDRLTLGHYPQSFHGVTLGGAIMANGSGQRSDRYGRVADNLVSARIATASGIWSTEAFRHAAAGPWLGGLVAGSEGLFGILTDATFRLHKRPEHVEDRVWLFPSFSAASEAVRELAQIGHSLAMLRVSDEAETEFLTGFRLARAGLDQPAVVERTLLALKRAPKRPALLIAGYEGSNEGAGPAYREARRVFGRLKGVALGRRAGASWRKGRYDAPHLRESLMARGLGVDTFETAVSWSKLEALHEGVREALAASIKGTLDGGPGRPAVFCHLSHSYVEGACLYFTAIFPRIANALAQWKEIKRAAMASIVAHGGALSHHHGLGADHAPWAAGEKSETGLALLTAMARTLDPQGVMAVGASSLLPEKN